MKIHRVVNELLQFFLRNRAGGTTTILQKAIREAGVFCYFLVSSRGYANDIHRGWDGDVDNAIAIPIDDALAAHIRGKGGPMPILVDNSAMIKLLEDILDGDLLTMAQLTAMRPSKVFACGIAENGTSPDQINLLHGYAGRPLLWLAIKGASEVPDWTIYADWLNDPSSRYPETVTTDLIHIIRSGHKVEGERNIRTLVPCTFEAYQMYRH